MHLNSQLQKGGGLEKILMDLCLNSNNAKNFLCIINEKWSEDYIKLINQNIDTYKIDYTNINSDILVINEKLK